MRRIKISRSSTAALFALIVLCGSNIFGQPSKATDENDERMLRRLEDEWLACYVTGNKSKYDSLVAEEFTGTDESAVVRGKAEDRALLPAAPVPGASAVNEEIKVRSYGSFAVVTGQIVTKARIGDKEIAGFRTRFTDTWIKRNGEWTVVARHYSRVPIERIVAKVDATIFEEYKGRYEIGPGVEVMISMEGTKLFAKFPWQSKLEFLPESESVFFTKEIQALFIFMRDKSGRVSRLLTLQDGKVTAFARIP